MEAAPPEWLEWCSCGHRDELPLRAWPDDAVVLPDDPPAWLEEVMDDWDARLGDWRAAYKLMPKSNNEMRKRATIDEGIDSEWTSADHGLRGLPSVLWTLAGGVHDAGWQNFTAAELAIAALCRELTRLEEWMQASGAWEAEDEYCEVLGWVAALTRGVTASQALHTTDVPRS